MEEDEAQCSYDDFEYNYNSITSHTSIQEIDKDDNGSDDSMASDASSGPSHHQHHLVMPSRSKESTGTARFKRDMKQSKNKSTNKQEKKRGEKGTKRKWELGGDSWQLKKALLLVLLTEKMVDYSCLLKL